jgi:hypothetical protein
MSNFNNPTAEERIMDQTVRSKFMLVLAMLLMLPVIAFGVDFQVDVQIQSDKYVPEILQYWDSTTGTPPWIQENPEQFEADWDRFLGNWDEIATGLSQDTEGTITFNQLRNICEDDVLNAIKTEVMRRIAEIAGDNFLKTARVEALVLSATSGNFGFVTSANDSVTLNAFPGTLYLFTGALSEDKTVLTLTPDGVRPDLAPLFAGDDSLDKCATNRVTVTGTIPTTEVTFNVQMLLDVKADVNSDITEEDYANDLLDEFDAADQDGDDQLDRGEVRLVFPGMTDEEFNSLDRDNDGFLTTDELERTINGGCGCSCGDDAKTAADFMGDYLLIGLSALVLLGFAAVNKRA